MSPTHDIPKYLFMRPDDFKDFQGEVHGKHLHDSFNVRQITSDSSSKNRKATDQHLKIWKDRASQGCTISFYASAVPKVRDIEFPLTIFDQELVREGGAFVRLNFIGVESKLGRSVSKIFGRSSTERSSSSVMTSKYASSLYLPFSDNLKRQEISVEQKRLALAPRHLQQPQPLLEHPSRVSKAKVGKHVDNAQNPTYQWRI